MQEEKCSKGEEAAAGSQEAMPIRIQSDLPAGEVLDRENIFVMEEGQADLQNIRPLEILILNLMPLKEDTELQLLRSLSNTPLQLNITFLTVTTHHAKNTKAGHLNQFYQEFSDIRASFFDGMIITGAPVELMKFEEVDYWNELCEILDWTTDHVTSTLHLCWGAQAALYHHYGLSDFFFAPHSRWTEVSRDEIMKCDDLVILSESDEAGVFLVMSRNGRRIFVMGHPEYDRLTLDQEYQRDRKKGISIRMPVNYYPDDDPDNKPKLSWRAHANTLYTNWINYYCYQLTPYSLGTRVYTYENLH